MPHEISLTAKTLHVHPQGAENIAHHGPKSDHIKPHHSSHDAPVKNSKIWTSSPMNENFDSETGRSKGPSPTDALYSLTENNLLDELIRSCPEAISFFFWTGLLPPTFKTSSPRGKLLYPFKLLYTLALRSMYAIMIVICVLIFLVIGTNTVTKDHAASNSQAIFLYIVVASFFVQSISLLVGIILLSKRLRKPSLQIDVLHFKEAVPVSWRFYFVCLLMYLYYFIYEWVVYEPLFGVGFCFLQLFFFVPSVGLSVALIFVIADTQSCRAMLVECEELIDSKSLTFEHYLEVKKAIALKSDQNSWLNNSLILIATLNTICLVILLFIFPLPLYNVGYSIAMFVSVLAVGGRETLFFIVALYHIVKVNDLTQDVLNKLANSDYIATVHGTRVFASLLTCPPGFKVAGKRFTLAELQSTLGAVFSTVVAAVLKNIFQYASLKPQVNIHIYILNTPNKYTHIYTKYPKFIITYMLYAIDIKDIV